MVASVHITAYSLPEQAGSKANTVSDIRKPEYAVRPSAISPLRDYLEPLAAAHPGKSGFRIIEGGADSIRLRLALINTARHTLDLQYYAVHNDLTSNLLVEAMIRAADRGVRVRFLLDDISVGDVRKNLCTLDTIENIEVRIFNPISHNQQSLPARCIAFFRDFSRTTRRMHNKSLIVDNHMAITGGRNLGDEYFDIHKNISFKDIDVLTAGDITLDISKSYDLYWNSEHARRLSSLYACPRGRQENFRKKLSATRRKNLTGEQDYADFTRTYTDYAAMHQATLTWAEAEFSADTPEKVEQEKQDVPVQSPVQHIFSIADKAQEEFLIVSPYFVPEDRGLQWIRSLTNRGVKVRIITNSLSSTDVVAVHAGYGPFRPALLQAGAELYEMKAANGKRPHQRLLGRKAPSYASLHAKVYIVDRKIAFVGSLNFDPRSIKLNTEVGLVIHSPDIAEELSSLYETVMKPETCYRLDLDKHGKIRWHHRERGAEKIAHFEPKAGLWRRVQEAIARILPVQEQL